MRRCMDLSGYEGQRTENSMWRNEIGVMARIAQIAVRMTNRSSSEVPINIGVEEKPLTTRDSSIPINSNEVRPSQ